MFKTTCLQKLKTGFILLAILISGCATTPLQSLRVTLTDTGRIMVNNKRTNLEEVGKAVKRAGAKSGTMIEISVPATASSSLCRTMKKNIAQAGFPKIFFVRGRRSSATVKKEEKTGSKKR